MASPPPPRRACWSATWRRRCRRWWPRPPPTSASTLHRVSFVADARLKPPLDADPVLVSGRPPLAGGARGDGAARAPLVPHRGAAPAEAPRALGQAVRRRRRPAARPAVAAGRAAERGRLLPDGDAGGRRPRAPHRPRRPLARAAAHARHRALRADPPAPDLRAGRRPRRRLERPLRGRPLPGAGRLDRGHALRRGLLAEGLSGLDRAWALRPLRPRLRQRRHPQLHARSSSSRPWRASGAPCARWARPTTPRSRCAAS